MGTSSYIGLYNGVTVDYMYVLYDSGLLDAGLKLQMWFNDVEKVKELIKLKRIYSVYDKIKPEIDIKDENVLKIMFQMLSGHKLTGWCFVSKKIRKPRQVSLETFLKIPMGEENYKYIYSLKDRCWYVCGNYDGSNTKMWRLSKLLKDEEYLQAFVEKEGYSDSMPKIQKMFDRYNSHMRGEVSIEPELSYDRRNYKITNEGNTFFLYKSGMLLCKGTIYEVAESYAIDYLRGYAKV